jgi:hypothetical protein
MKTKFNLLILILTISFTSYSQNQIIYPQGGAIGAMSYVMAKEIMPEHGFLPGKKFPTYPTVEPFDFNNLKLKVTLYNDRDEKKLSKINCSEIGITNETELKGEQGTVKVWDYLNTLFLQSKIVIETTSSDELEVRLTALDCRLIGFGQIAVHGLCQIEFKYKGITKTYCTDIEDGDKNAPLTKSSFVSRKTATRYMASASIRETIEKFLTDLKDWK